MTVELVHPPHKDRGASAPQRAGADLTVRERIGALRNVPPLFRLVWQTSPPLFSASLALRLVRALVPVTMLYVGKLIVDEDDVWSCSCVLGRDSKLAEPW